MCSVPNPDLLGGNLCFIDLKLDFSAATVLFNMAKRVLQVTRGHGAKRISHGDVNNRVHAR